MTPELREKMEAVFAETKVEFDEAIYSLMEYVCVFISETCGEDFTDERAAAISGFLVEKMLVGISDAVDEIIEEEDL